MLQNKCSLQSVVLSVVIYKPDQNCLFNVLSDQKAYQKLEQDVATYNRLGSSHFLVRILCKVDLEQIVYQSRLHSVPTKEPLSRGRKYYKLTNMNKYIYKAIFS